MPYYTQVPADVVTEFSICSDCSAIVYYEGEHDEFHERIDQIGKTARAADNTAQLFRPLG